LPFLAWQVNESGSDWLIYEAAGIISYAFETFYDLIKENVKSIVLSDSTSVTIKTYTGAFPDKSLDKKEDYPIIVINSPDINWQTLTIKKFWVNGSITIDTYTTKAEAADKFADLINYVIENNRDDLRSAGFMFVRLDGTSKDEVTRGDIKVHLKSLTYTFKYVIKKTETW